MKISTRGRYAVKVMHELARDYQKNSKRVMDLRQIAKNQKLSLKYIEHIISKLRRSGLVESARGVTGGYRLSRPPEKITSFDILETTENITDFCPCFKQTTECPFEKACGVCAFWKDLRAMLTKHLKGITLADILCMGSPGPRK